MQTGMLSYRTLNVLAMIASAGLLAAGTFLLWQLLAPSLTSPSSSTDTVSSVVIDTPVAAPPYQLDNLLDQNLFGELAATTSIAKPKPRPNKSRKPLPPLNAKVLGIVYDGNGEGVAILSYRGKQQAYKTGEFLNMDETVLLEKVESGKVYLKRGEQQETLVLKAKKNANPINISPDPKEQSDDPEQLAEALKDLKKRAIERIQAGTKPLNSPIKVQHNRSSLTPKKSSL